MNRTGCVTALGDGGEAFVVLLSDDDHCRRRLHSEHPSLPPLPPLATADPYKSRPRRKDRGAFVVLPDPSPVASSQQTGCSGRVSPFRGHGFRTPENGRSRASSPSSGPLRRQSSEPRIATGRPRAAATKQRLSVSTKDLSAVGKTAAGKPPSVPSTKICSPRNKPAGSRSGPSTPRKQPAPKSPLPQRSPKTPRRSQPPAAAKPAIAAKPTVTAKPTVAPKPKTGANSRITGATRPTAATANRPQPAMIKSSPRASKKHSPVATEPSGKADNVLSTKHTANTRGDVPVPMVATAATAAAAATTAAMATTAAAATTTAPSSHTLSATAVAAPAAAYTASTSPTPTPTSTVTVMPITASTSATAIATTHATNAVVSAVVDGGPIVAAAPPPAAIAANTLATLSVAGAAAAAAKPPPSAMRPREPPAAAKQNPSTVVVVDRGFATQPVPAQRSAADKLTTTTTTPPLSYELQEIVVEPEMENQSGTTAAARLLVGGTGNKTSSTATTTSSNGGHKTVAWARQSEKIIVPAEVPNRVAETTVASTTKDPAYKRFARKLCGGGGGRRRPTKASSVAAADGRTPKCWTAVWKRRPRWCGPRCCGRKRKDAGRPTAAAAAVAVAAGGRRPQWWRRCNPCWCCGKRKKRLGTAVSSSSADSVGVLGISPPTTADTFCDKFKRRACCRCGCCVVPKFFRRLCCCCPCCGGSGKRPDVRPKSKSADTQRPSQFKCTGCCTNIPKLDAVFVDHSSVMKGAIPVLPVTLAWLCLVFNVIIPGAGTFSSGMLCLCVGKPRFTVNDNFQSRVGAFCVNFIVAVAQLFTVLFCLVGWGWSIWWGVIMLKMAKKYQKVKIIDRPVDVPIVVDHNHQI